MCKNKKRIQSWKEYTHAQHIARLYRKYIHFQRLLLPSNTGLCKPDIIKAALCCCILPPGRIFENYAARRSVCIQPVVNQRKLFTDLNKLYTFRARRRWWEWPQWYIIQLLQTERGAAARKKKFIFPTWHRGKKQFDLLTKRIRRIYFYFLHLSTDLLTGRGWIQEKNIQRWKEGISACICSLFLRSKWIKSYMNPFSSCLLWSL